MQNYMLFYVVFSRFIYRNSFFFVGLKDFHYSIIPLRYFYDTFTILLRYFYDTFTILLRNGKYLLRFTNLEFSFDR